LVFGVAVFPLPLPFEPFITVPFGSLRVFVTTFFCAITSPIFQAIVAVSVLSIVRNLSTTCSINQFGVEAPAVTPTRRTPARSSGLISSAVSIRKLRWHLSRHKYCRARSLRRQSSPGDLDYLPRQHRAPLSLRARPDAAHGLRKDRSRQSRAPNSLPTRAALQARRRERV